MPTTRKQKKARKSRGLEILSDIENLDIMLGDNCYNGTERERSLDNNFVGRRESITSNNLDNEGESLFSNCRNDELRTNADFGQNSAEANSLTEINRLSSELNSRISREMDEVMNNVGIQIQRAINEAINSQVLPQIQNVIMAGSGRQTGRGWEVPVERPETNAEDRLNSNAKSNLRNEQGDNHRFSENTTQHVHDRRTLKKNEQKLHSAEKIKWGPFWSRPVLYVTWETFLVQFLGPTGTFWRLFKILLNFC